MRAMVFKAFGAFEARQLPEPVLDQPDQVLIKVLACGICGTDVNLSQAPSSYGPMQGRVLGHELVGDVAAVGPAVTSLTVGDRVVVNPNTYCGVCAFCRQGQVNHCAHMQLMGITHPGAFAEYTLSSERMVFPIDRSVPLHQALFAEPLACALNGFSRLDIQPEETFLQIGCGPIGLLFAQLARLSGARVIGLEPKTGRREIARALGFEALPPDRPDLKEQVQHTWGQLADHVVDAAGGQLALAVDLAAVGATLLTFAAAGVQAEASIRAIGPKELTIHGSFIIKNTMGRAVRLLESGRLALDPLVSHRLPLEALAEGLRLIQTGEAMKVMIDVTA